MLTDAASYKGLSQYAQVALYSMLFPFELQRRLDAKGITNVISVVAQPGVVGHPDIPNNFPEMQPTQEIAQKQMHSPERGALPLLYASAAPGVLGGDYYGPNGPLGMSGDTGHSVPSAFALSEEDARQLWAISEKMAQLEFDV